VTRTLNQKVNSTSNSFVKDKLPC